MELLLTWLSSMVLGRTHGFGLALRGLLLLQSCLAFGLLRVSLGEMTLQALQLRCSVEESCRLCLICSLSLGESCSMRMAHALEATLHPRKHLAQDALELLDLDQELVG